MRIRICHEGFFAGEFIITDEYKTFSIGNYIEVYLKGPPYDTGKTILNGSDKEVSIIALPLVIMECCHTDRIEVILELPVCRSLKHWIKCLEIDKISVVTPYKFQYRNHIWYWPKIDGWIPGLYRKVKVREKQ